MKHKGTLLSCHDIWLMPLMNDWIIMFRWAQWKFHYLPYIRARLMVSSKGKLLYVSYSAIDLLFTTPTHVGVIYIFYTLFLPTYCCLFISHTLLSSSLSLSIPKLFLPLYLTLLTRLKVFIHMFITVLSCYLSGQPSSSFGLVQMLHMKSVIDGCTFPENRRGCFSKSREILCRWLMNGTLLTGRRKE